MAEDAEHAAVRAFLDAFEASDGSECVSAPPEVAADAVDIDDGPLDWRKRGYSKLLRRRKLSKMQELRGQVEELETQLMALRQSSDASSSRALDQAVVAERSEIVARRRSEKANQLLHERQKRLGRLRGEIAERIQSYLRQESIVARVEIPKVEVVPVMLEDPHLTLQAMIAQVDGVFSSTPLHPVDAISSCSLTSSSLPNGNEVRSTVAARCDVATAAWLLWGRRPCENPPLQDDGAVDGNNYRREIFLPLQTRRMEEVQLTVQHIGQRVHDPMTGRVVLVILSLIRVPSLSDDVLLSEQFWTRITPTNELGATGSITHACYQIRTRPVAVTSQVSAMQDRVRHSLVVRTRRDNINLQNWLLNAAPAGLAC